MRKCGICREVKSDSEFTYSGAKKAFHYACKPCVKTKNHEYYLANTQKIKDQVKDYRIRNRDRCRENMCRYHQERRRKYRKLVFDHYGWKCACCGESLDMFLTIDHINNDGVKFREKTPVNGAHFYYWIVQNNYPTDLQTLCWNCNCAKRINGGVCPHITEGSTTRPKGRTVK